MRALLDFGAWRKGAPINRETVRAWRDDLVLRGLSASSINQKMAAVKLLAREAAQSGAIDTERSQGIQQIPGVKQRGDRTGNWLTKDEAQRLVTAPHPQTLPGKRDRAALALLVGCGLRRGEATALTVEHIQERDGHWAIIDLHGKHGRVRTVPMPAWVKGAVDEWLQAARISQGRVLRSIDLSCKLGESISPQWVHRMVNKYGNRIGRLLGAHDLRRTCAKLSRSAGGELEQIQMLLGHSSIDTTERYLGTRQDLTNAPNDKWRLKL